MSDKMNIIAFTGLPGAGKSEAVLVAKELGYIVFRIGDCVVEETKNRGLPLDDKNIGSVADEMRHRYGFDAWARRTYEKIKKVKSQRIVIDGVRNIEELDFFCSVFPEFKLIAVEAPFEIRCRRLMDRGRSDAPKDMKECRERDGRELSWGLGKLMEKADIRILNNGSLEDFRNRIRKILEIRV